MKATREIHKQRQKFQAIEIKSETQGLIKLSILNANAVTSVDYNVLAKILKDAEKSTNDEVSVKLGRIII